jgi:hypothetical protein
MNLRNGQKVLERTLGADCGSWHIWPVFLDLAPRSMHVALANGTVTAPPPGLDISALPSPCKVSINVDSFAPLGPQVSQR